MAAHDRDRQTEPLTRAVSREELRGELAGLRVALVAPSLDILGGQGIQAQALAGRLRDEGCDVTFVPINPRFPRVLQWVRRIPRVRTVLNEALYLARLPALRRADVIHVFSASYWSFLLAPAPAIVAGRLLGKRVLLNYRSGEADDHLAHWGPLVHPWLRLVTEIVVPSNFLREVFARYGYRARVVRNIVDFSQYRFRDRAPIAPRLLSNRNFEAHYRVEDIIEAFALVRRRCPTATLVLGGDGSHGEKLRALADSLGVPDVRFVGKVAPSDMPVLYESADIFVNASVIDNQPVSILEAFAAGTVVVSTGTGDIPAMVVDRETGLIVPPRDPRAIADAVEMLVRNPDYARELAHRARAEVQKYSWPEVRRQWAELYLASAA